MMNTKHNKWMVRWFIIIYFFGAVPIGVVVTALSQVLSCSLSKTEHTFYTLMTAYLIIGIIALLLYGKDMLSEIKKENSVMMLIKKIFLSSMVLLIIEAAANVIYGILGGTETQNEKILNISIRTPIFVFGALLVMVILAPIVEEIIFRFILQNYLNKKVSRYSSVVSIVGTSIIFAMFHAGVTPEITVYIVIGMVLGFAYKKTDNLVVVIVAHMINNLIAYLI